MNVGMMIYAAFALMVLTVFSNRYWHRQVTKTRVQVNKLREKVDDLQGELAAVASSYATLAHETATVERRAERAERELVIAQQALEARKNSDTEQYYIFDRLEPRPGRFWEVAIRHQPDAAEERERLRTWTGVRRYILVADAEKEARTRAASRFPRKAGFDVVTAMPCQVANLTISRVSEVSTFRKPGAGDETGNGNGNSGRRASGRS